MYTAVYKVGNEIIDGHKAQCMIVKDANLHLALDEGWVLTLSETTLKKYTDVEPPATREEMLQKAEQIGLKVDKRWSDARLLAEIEKA